MKGEKKGNLLKGSRPLHFIYFFIFFEPVQSHTHPPMTFADICRRYCEEKNRRKH